MSMICGSSTDSAYRSGRRYTPVETQHNNHCFGERVWGSSESIDVRLVPPSALRTCTARNRTVLTDRSHPRQIYAHTACHVNVDGRESLGLKLSDFGFGGARQVDQIAITKDGVLAPWLTHVLNGTGGVQ